MQAVNLRRILCFWGGLGLCACASAPVPVRVAQLNTQVSATGEELGFDGLYLVDPLPELASDSRDSVCALSALPQGGHLLVTSHGYSIGKLIGGQTVSRFDGVGADHEAQFMRDGRGRICVLRSQDGRQRTLARVHEPRFENLWRQLSQPQVFRVANHKQSGVAVMRLLLSSLRDPASRTTRLIDANAFKLALGRFYSASATEQYLKESGENISVAELAGYLLGQEIDQLRSEHGVLPELLERLSRDRKLLEPPGPSVLPVEEDEWILRTAESIFGGASVVVRGLVAEIRDPSHVGDACNRAVLLPLPNTAVRLRASKGSMVESYLLPAGRCCEAMAPRQKGHKTTVPEGMQLFLDQNGRAIGLFTIGYMWGMAYGLKGVPLDTVEQLFRAADEGAPDLGEQLVGTILKNESIITYPAPIRGSSAPSCRKIPGGGKHLACAR